MLQINLDTCETVKLSNIDEAVPIFAYKKTFWAGMIIKNEEGWILRTGSTAGATGYHDTLKKCIQSCLPFGYTFFVED